MQIDLQAKCSANKVGHNFYCQVELSNSGALAGMGILLHYIQRDPESSCCVSDSKTKQSKHACMHMQSCMHACMPACLYNVSTAVEQCCACVHVNCYNNSYECTLQCIIVQASGGGCIQWYCSALSANMDVCFEVCNITVIKNKGDAKHEWHAETSIVDNVEMLHIAKGDVGFTKWLSGSRAYNTVVSSIISELSAIVCTASKAALGETQQEEEHKISKFKKMKHNQTLKNLQEQSICTFVDICLPAFNEVPPVECKACIDTTPVCIYIELVPDVLRWVYLRHQACEKPAKRVAEHPPLDKGITWHKNHQSYIARTMSDTQSSFRKVRLTNFQGDDPTLSKPAVAVDHDAGCMSDAEAAEASVEAGA